MENAKQELNEVVSKIKDEVTAVVKAVEHPVLTVENKFAIRDAQVELAAAREAVRTAEKKLIDTVNVVKSALQCTANNFDLASLKFYD